MADSPAEFTGPEAAQLVKAMPFASGLGVEIESASAEQVVAHLPWRADLCTTGGILHGGALMSLADSAGAVCAFLNLPPERTTATTQSSTNLFRAARAGTVTATARPLHRGRSLIVVQTDLTDTDGRLLAQTTQSQAVLPLPG